MEKNKLTFDMLGTSFSIAVDESPAYLANLLERYKRIIDDTRRQTGLQDPLRIAILAGFLLCDDLEKNKKQRQYSEQDGREAEKLTMDLITRINEALDSSGAYGAVPPGGGLSGGGPSGNTQGGGKI